MRRLMAGVAWCSVAWCGAAFGGAEEDAEMARRVTQALTAVLQGPRPNYQEMVGLLMAERFDEFEKRSKAYEERFAQDPQQEMPLWTFYSTPSADDAFLAKLDKWVAQRPSSYAALTMRGLYHAGHGFHQRGSRYASETPRANFNRMDESHRRARADLTQALRLRPGFLPAYGGMLQLEQAHGDIEAADQLIAEVVRAHPATYYVRHTYLRNLRPRWGGSYEAMASFAKAQIPAARLNPRIWSLQGEAPAERARSAAQENDHAAAVRHYTEALRYGDRLEFLSSRAYSYWTLRQHANALKDYERYLQIQPGTPWVVSKVECLKLQMAGGKCAHEIQQAPKGDEPARPPQVHKPVQKAARDTAVHPAVGQG